MDKNFKGSSCNVLAQWEDGSETWEPLHIIAADDPVTCVLYATENDLLDTASWKHFKHIAKHENMLKRMLNQAVMKAIRQTTWYKFGVAVPFDYRQAKKFDKQNGNTYWQDAMDLELHQVKDEYGTFRDLGKNARPPSDYAPIKVHFVFDVKANLKCKARLVAGGHMTEIPKESCYSGVVSLCSLCIITFLAELNDLELMAGDISNAYLTAYTKEKLYVIAGKEFGELEGHVLIIVKALYGLRTSGA